MGIPDEPFWAPTEVVDAYRAMARGRCREQRQRWEETLDELSTEERAAWDAAWAGTGLKGWEEALPVFEQGEEMATRQAMVKVLAAVIERFPGLVAGAADLTGNTGVKLPDGVGTQTAESHGGRQLYYGIREHAMGAALVGMAQHGGILPLGGTFFAFLDYIASPCGSPPCPTPRPCSCSATTRSVSGRTARPTSRSSSRHRSARCPSCRSSAPRRQRTATAGGPLSTSTVQPCSC